MTKNTAILTKELRLLEEELGTKKKTNKEEQEQFKNIRNLLRSLGEKPRDFSDKPCPFKFGDLVSFSTAKDGNPGKRVRAIFVQQSKEDKSKCLLMGYSEITEKVFSITDVKIPELRKEYAYAFPETVYTCHEGKVLSGFLINSFSDYVFTGWFKAGFGGEIVCMTLNINDIYKSYEEAKKALNKVVIPERLKEIRNFRSSTRPATEADYVSWLNSYLKNGGTIFDERPYEFPKDVYLVATESFKLPDMYGASSIELIVPEGITVTYEKLGHNEIYFVEGGVSTNEYVEIYAGMLN